MKTFITGGRYDGDRSQQQVEGIGLGPMPVPSSIPLRLRSFETRRSTVNVDEAIELGASRVKFSQKYTVRQTRIIAIGLVTAAACLVVGSYMLGRVIALNESSRVISHLTNGYEDGLSDACMLHPDTCIDTDKRFMEHEGWHIIHGTHPELLWTRGNGGSK